MKFMHKFLPAALSASIMLGVVAGPALAAPPEQPALPFSKEYQVRCSDGACEVEVGMAGASDLAKLATGAAVVVLQDKLDFLPEGAGIEVRDGLVLRLPVGDLRLPNAELSLALNDDNTIQRLHGTAEVPFPTFGVLDDVEIIKPAVADVGYDTGANLEYLGAPLSPERHYIFFNFGTGLDLAGQISPQAEAFRLSVPRGQQATLVLDTEEPVVYLAGTITLNEGGPLALAGDLLGGESLAAAADGLPLMEHTTFHVSALLGEGVEDAYVRVGGRYGVDGGRIDDLVGLDIRPIAVEGLLTASRDGLLLAGQADSGIQPDSIFRGDVAVEAFVPFREEETGYLVLDSNAAIPAARISAAASAALTEGQEPRLEAALVTPLSKPKADTVIVVEPAGLEMAGATPEAAPSPVRQLVASLLARVAGGVEQGKSAVAEVSGQGLDWAGRRAADAQAAVSGLLPAGAGR